jgi:dynein intermediate chain 1
LVRFPEYVFATDSGVMSVDFHPQHASLLAVGLYDGTVAVYDLQLRQARPIFQSTTKSGKHTGARAGGRERGREVD